VTPTGARTALGAVLVALLCATAAVGDDAAATVLFDFEKGEPTDGWRARKLTMKAIATPHGRGLQLSAAGDEKASNVGSIEHESSVRDWRTFRAFAMQVRVDATSAAAMRVIAVGAGGRGRLLRRFTVEPGDWREIVLELKDFRDDGEDQAGSFADVDRVVLRWDAGRGDASIDDLRLLPGDRGEQSCAPTSDDWLHLAFGGTKARRTEGDHFVVLDDVAALTDADAKRIVDRLEEGLKILADRYGVVGELGTKIPLFVFATRTEYEEFIPRLGEHFGATVDAPTADGFGIFGVAMSSWDPKQGWDRSVYVHEAMHAAIHRRLAVASNGNWIQEAPANAVQARIHPDSLDRARLADGFAKRAGAVEPWAKLFAAPKARMSQYPSLLSVMDFLAETRRESLARIWSAVRALDRPLHVAAPEAIAKTLGVDVAKLEDEWFAWGAKFYASPQK